MEHCIAYFSSSVILLQESDLVSLLQQSRLYNARAGITGILLINQGSIVQVLEGKQEIIDGLYKRIEADRRHTDVVKLVDCPIEERLFAGWSMGCKSITNHQLEVIKTIIDSREINWPLTKPSTNGIVKMLKSTYHSDPHNLEQVTDPVVTDLLYNHVQEWKQHYKQLAQAVEAVENEFKKRFVQVKESTLYSPEVDQEQQVEEIRRSFESNRMLIWERQQGELSKNFIFA